MDTSGRAILLAGTTIVIALLGMFATGVAFMYGLAIASALGVLLTMMASLTLLPALLSRFGTRLVRVSGSGERHGVSRESAWRRWSETVRARPWPLAIASVTMMVALLIPAFALRLDTSDGRAPPQPRTPPL